VKRVFGLKVWGSGFLGFEFSTNKGVTRFWMCLNRTPGTAARHHVPLENSNLMKRLVLTGLQLTAEDSG